VKKKLEVGGWKYELKKEKRDIFILQSRKINLPSPFRARGKWIKRGRKGNKSQETRLRKVVKINNGNIKTENKTFLFYKIER